MLTVYGRPVTIYGRPPCGDITKTSKVLRYLSNVRTIQTIHFELKKQFVVVKELSNEFQMSAT